MYTLSVKNKNDDVLKLSSNPNYTLYKIDGLAPPKATITNTVNATQDGAVINASRVESRNIVLYMTINGDVESNRINLYKWFTSKKSISIFFETDYRSLTVEGVVETVEIDLFANPQIAQVSIICPQPYFKGVDDLIVSFSENNDAFQFPFSIDEVGIEFAMINANARKTILYSGDVENGILIQLFANGRVDTPTLYDVLDKTHMTIDTVMNEGDSILIDTNVGRKTITLIRDGIEYNALGYMTLDSDWFTIKSGDNVFTYDCVSGSSNLDLTFTTALLYGGV